MTPLLELMPKAAAPHEREWIHLGDHRARSLVASARSNDAFWLAEVEADFGGGVPPHIHTREDETFVVLQGDFEVMLDGEITRATVHDSAFAPRGLAHSWRCLSEDGGRLLLLVSPGQNFETFARHLSAQIGDALEIPNLDALLALAEQHGLVMLPPTLSSEISFRSQ